MPFNAAITAATNIITMALRNIRKDIREAAQQCKSALVKGEELMSLHDQLNKKLGDISCEDANIDEIHYDIDEISLKLDKAVDALYTETPAVIGLWAGITDIPPFIQQELCTLKTNVHDIVAVLKVLKLGIFPSTSNSVSTSASSSRPQTARKQVRCYVLRLHLLRQFFPCTCFLRRVRGSSSRAHMQ